MPDGLVELDDKIAGVLPPASKTRRTGFALHFRCNIIARKNLLPASFRGRDDQIAIGFFAAQGESLLRVALIFGQARIDFSTSR